METPYREALGVLGRTFEDRIRQCAAPMGERDGQDYQAFVFPVSVEEVQLLSEVAERYSVPLVVEGARTISNLDTGPRQRGILIRFDLMRRRRLPTDPEEAWVWAEPGIPWLELNDELLAWGRGLAVYPTIVAGFTVGDWLVTDGIGVGSFEYGRLRENVLRSDVVLSGGKRREVPGEDLPSLVGPGRCAGVVVSATLRTRRADRDTNFAIAFDKAQTLLGAVTEVTEAGMPLWHLGFLNPEMASARHLEETYLLFGAYPGERAAEIEPGLGSIFEAYRARPISVAECCRAWGKRLLPATTSRLGPSAVRELVSLVELPEMLCASHTRRTERVALQGIVSRSGEVQILTLEAREQG